MILVYKIVQIGVLIILALGVVVLFVAAVVRTIDKMRQEKK